MYMMGRIEAGCFFYQDVHDGQDRQDRGVMFFLSGCRIEAGVF
jgi:hypothetical protein